MTYPLMGGSLACLCFLYLFLRQPYHLCVKVFNQKRESMPKNWQKNRDASHFFLKNPLVAVGCMPSHDIPKAIIMRVKMRKGVSPK